MSFSGQVAVNAGHSTDGKRPELVSLVAPDFRAWRVVRVTDLPQLDTGDAGRHRIEVRPLDESGREGAIHVTKGGPRNSWPILTVHYAVCGHYGDVVRVARCTRKRKGKPR